jgi:TPR repeat protein
MKLSRMLLIALTCVTLQACTNARTAENLQLGKMTFNNGDFKQAFRQLLPLASEGNADAEYAVGYMYYYGYGVAEDSDTGIFWMQKAADKGNSSAKKALETIRTNKNPKMN